MLDVLRKHAAMCLLVMIGLFTVAAFADAYGDAQRGAQTLCVQASNEVSQEDIDFDDFDDIDDLITPAAEDGRAFGTCNCVAQRLLSRGHRSDEWWRGLVRRVFPRPMPIVCAGHASGMNPTWICTAFVLLTN